MPTNYIFSDQEKAMLQKAGFNLNALVLSSTHGKSFMEDLDYLQGQNKGGFNLSVLSKWKTQEIRWLKDYTVELYSSSPKDPKVYELQEHFVEYVVALDQLNVFSKRELVSLDYAKMIALGKYAEGLVNKGFTKEQLLRSDAVKIEVVAGCADNLVGYGFTSQELAQYDVEQIRLLSNCKTYFIEQYKWSKSNLYDMVLGRYEYILDLWHVVTKCLNVFKLHNDSPLLQAVKTSTINGDFESVQSLLSLLRDSEKDRNAEEGKENDKNKVIVKDIDYICSKGFSLEQIMSGNCHNLLQKLQLFTSNIKGHETWQWKEIAKWGWGALADKLNKWLGNKNIDTIDTINNLCLYFSKGYMPSDKNFNFEDPSFISSELEQDVLDSVYLIHYLVSKSLRYSYERFGDEILNLQLCKSDLRSLVDLYEKEDDPLDSIDLKSMANLYKKGVNIAQMLSRPEGYRDEICHHLNLLLKYGPDLIDIGLKPEDIVKQKDIESVHRTYQKIKSYGYNLKGIKSLVCKDIFYMASDNMVKNFVEHPTESIYRGAFASELSPVERLETVLRLDIWKAEDLKALPSSCKKLDIINILYANIEVIKALEGSIRRIIDISADIHDLDSLLSNIYLLYSCGVTEEQLVDLGGKAINNIADQAYGANTEALLSIVAKHLNPAPITEIMSDRSDSELSDRTEGHPEVGVLGHTSE